MQTPAAHVRTFGDGAVVEVTFDAVEIKPCIVQIATACNNQLTVTHATAKQTGSLREHIAAWIEHAKTVGMGTGQNVMWLLTAQSNASSVSVRELMLAMQAIQQLPDLEIGVLMCDIDITAFVQHWQDADNAASTLWSQMHLFRNVTGLHAFVASRSHKIKHVCAVSGAIRRVVNDMFVNDETALHAVVHDGSFLYTVPQRWPMAIVHDDMPMLAAEHGTAFVQTRGTHDKQRCSTIEIRQNAQPGCTATRSKRMRLLYVSSFCDQKAAAARHPVQWLRGLLSQQSDVQALQNDSLLLSLVLRATAAHSPCASTLHALPAMGGVCTRQPQAITSPHLHRSITQQMQNS